MKKEAKEAIVTGPLRQLLDQAVSVSRAQLLAYYRFPKGAARYLYRGSWIASKAPPERIESSLELVSFMSESLQPVVASRRETTPMKGLFLEPDHRSALAMPFVEGRGDGKILKGILFLSSSADYRFSGSLIRELEKLIQLVPNPEVRE